jgi:RNA polymerase sigma-70 factor, ECF subfamily
MLVCRNQGYTELTLMNPTDRANPTAVPSRARPVDDEAALVAAAKGGDIRAFETLVRRYEGRIYRLTYNITQNREDAEDSTQDAFLKSYQHLPDFQGDSRFYTWLVRIAVNEALMKLRRRRPNEVSLDESIQTDEDVLPREIEDWGPKPDQRFEQAELQGILARSIAQLEPPYRIVFQLRDIEELSTEETAQLLGLSVPAVKSRLLRARLKLRHTLDQLFRGGARSELQGREL